MHVYIQFLTIICMREPCSLCILKHGCSMADHKIPLCGLCGCRAFCVAAVPANDPYGRHVWGFVCVYIYIYIYIHNIYKYIYIHIRTCINLRIYTLQEYTYVLCGMCDVWGLIFQNLPWRLFPHGTFDSYDSLCVYIYMYIYIYIHTHACMHICMYVRIEHEIKRIYVIQEYQYDRGSSTADDAPKE